MKSMLEHDRRITWALALMMGLFAFSNASAEVRLPGFFSDHMVFQQQQPIKIWGWAESGEIVKVQLGKGSLTTSTAAGFDGRWVVGVMRK